MHTTAAGFGHLYHLFAVAAYCLQLFPIACYLQQVAVLSVVLDHLLSIAFLHVLLSAL